MWPCPKCFEPLEDSFESCWKCGTSREGIQDPDFHPVGRPTPAEIAALQASLGGFFRCSRCKTPIDPGHPDSCRGCGAPLQAIPDAAVQGRAGAASPVVKIGSSLLRRSPLVRIESIILPLSMVIGLLSCLFLVATVGSMFPNSNLGWALGSGGIFMAAVAMIIHIDRNASEAGQSFAHLGCLVVLVVVALLFGLMAVVAAFS